MRPGEGWLVASDINAGDGKSLQTDPIGLLIRRQALEFAACTHTVLPSLAPVSKPGPSSGWLRVRDALKAWKKAHLEFEKARLTLDEAIDRHVHGDAGEKDVEAALVAIMEAGERMERARQQLRTSTG